MAAGFFHVSIRNKGAAIALGVLVAVLAIVVVVSGIALLIALAFIAALLAAGALVLRKLLGRPRHAAAPAARTRRIDPSLEVFEAPHLSPPRGDPARIEDQGRIDSGAHRRGDGQR